MVCPAQGETPSKQLQDFSWKAIARRRRNLWLYRMLWVGLPALAIAWAFLTTPVLAPRAWYRWALFGGLLGLGWMWFWESARKAARFRVAQYQVDVFDLQERGAPLWRYLETKRKEEAKKKGKVFQTDEIPLWPSPIQVAETFLEENLFGRNGPYSQCTRLLGLFFPFLLAYTPWYQAPVPSVPLKKGSRLFHPPKPDWQQLLWLGGQYLWYLDEHFAVALNHPTSDAFRVLVGPTFPPDVSFDLIDQGLCGVSIEKQREEQAPSEFFNRAFERPHVVFRFGEYTVKPGEINLRTRDGILIQVKGLEVTAEFRPTSYRKLQRFLCHFLRHDKPGDPPWFNDWMEHLNPDFLLKRELRGIVMGTMASFIREHTLEQIVNLLEPAGEEEKTLRYANYYLQRLQQMRQESATARTAASFVTLEQRLRERLRQIGFELKTLRLPTWRIPEELEQAHRAALANVRRLRGQLYEIRYRYYDRFYQEWFLEQFTRAVQLAHQLEQQSARTRRADVDDLFLEILDALVRPLFIGVDTWARKAPTWYGGRPLFQKPREWDDLEPEPPYPTQEAFMRALTRLRHFLSLVKNLYSPHSSVG